MAETCLPCLEKLAAARRPTLDPDSIASARAILEAVPPYGTKVTITVDGRKRRVCPRCDSVSADEGGPRPLAADYPNRRARRAARFAKKGQS